MDLCTLDDVKSWLRVKSTDDDALLSRLVTACSAAIERYCDRSFKRVTVTENRSGNGRQSLMLASYPVISVAQVKVGQTLIPPTSPGESMQGYLVDGRSIRLRGYEFARGVMNCCVTYDAGYDEPPAELAQACIELVAYRYRGRENTGLASKALAGETTSYITAEIPPQIKVMIGQFQRVAPV